MVAQNPLSGQVLPEEEDDDDDSGSVQSDSEDMDSQQSDSDAEPTTPDLSDPNQHKFPLVDLLQMKI